MSEQKTCENVISLTEQSKQNAVKKGRKPKYATDEERQIAKKLSNKKYLENKRKKLIEFRRYCEMTKINKTE